MEGVMYLSLNMWFGSPFAGRCLGRGGRSFFFVPEEVEAYMFFSPLS